MKEKKNTVYSLIDRKCVKTLQQHPLLSTKEKSFLFFPVRCSVFFFFVIISKYNKHVGKFLHSYPSYISSILHLYHIFHYFNYFVFQTRTQKVIHVFLTWLLYVQFIIWNLRWGGRITGNQKSVAAQVVFDILKFSYMFGVIK